MKLKVLFILSFLPVLIWGQVEQTYNIVTPDLETQMQKSEAQEMIRVNITLNEEYPMQDLYPSLKSLDKDARRSVVINELKNFSFESQKGLVSYLNNQKQYGQAEIIHEFWITNLVTAWATKDVIVALSQRDDIAQIDYDEERNLLKYWESVENKDDKNPENREITYNVTKVNANDVWALGYYGEGVIVSVIDTGVNYNHEDLQDHMWEDASYPYHGWDFSGNDNNPMDDHGHGTHCAGTVGGDGTAGSQTGMAPEATIMALKVLNSGGSGTESGVWNAIEFSVEHGADVISMSLGWLHSWNPNRPAWRNTYDNALAAGLVASVAAGNEGGNTNDPDDVRTPGDCPPPWLHPDQTLEGGLSAVVCVGATTSSDGIAYFSSRGPSSWETISPFYDYPHNPEMGLLRPDVSAPGVDIKSCAHYNNSGYTYMSGTSMATPGVAGVMALLLSKNPDLTPEEMAEVLQMTALDLGTSGKDNIFGAGRIDALEAINYITLPTAQAFAGDDAEICGNETYILNGDAINYTSVEWSTSGDGEFDDMYSLTPEYTPGTEDVAAGSVTLTLTAYGDNGDGTDEMILTIHALPELEVSGNMGLCAGESTLITYTLEGTAPWTLTFDDASTMEITDSPYEFEMTPEETTTYTVTSVEDASCTNDMEISYTIEVYEIPTIEVEGDMEICLEQSASITYNLTGTAPWLLTFDDAGTMEITESPYTFEVSPETTTAYTITNVADALCEDEVSVSYSVNVFDVPLVELGNDTSLCLNYTIVLDAGNPGMTYLWSTGDDTQSITVDSTGVDAEGNKTISVAVTNADGCETTDEIILNFYECLGIDEVSFISDLSIYPVPNNGTFTLSMNSKETSIAVVKLINAMGTIVYTEEFRITKGRFDKKIQVSSLQSDIYYLLIETDQGCLNRKVAITK